MATEVGKLIVRLIGDGSSYQKMLVKAEASAVAASKKIAAAGAKMSLAVTAPLVGLGGLAVREFAKFDKAMVESTSIMKTTAAQTKQMSDLAKKLSQEAPQGPDELARSYFFLASAGKNAEQSMALLPSVMKFATAGAFDMAQATDLLTDAQSALGLSSKNAAEDQKNLVRISDALVAANTLANASVEQFSQALTADAATAGKAFGQELEDIVGVLAVYADKGKKAAEAGNLYGRATRLLTKAQRDNAEVFEQFNIKVIDDATGGYRKLADIIKDMEVAFVDMTGPQKAAALEMMGFEALAQKSILPLLGSADAISQYTEKIKQMGGVTNDVADKQMGSFSNQMAVVKNQMKVLAMEAAPVLVDILRELAEIAKAVKKEWDALSPSMQKSIVKTLAITAAVGPALIAIGAMTKVVGLLVTAIKGVPAAMTLVSKHPMIALFTGTAAAATLVMDKWISKTEGYKRLVNGIKGALGMKKDFGEPDSIPIIDTTVRPEEQLMKEFDRIEARLNAKKKDDGLLSLDDLVPKVAPSSAPLPAELKERTKMEEAATKAAERYGKKLESLGASITNQYLTPAERFVKKQKELNELLDGGHISQDIFNRAIKDARDAMQELPKDKDININFKVNDVQAAIAGSAEAMSRIEKFKGLTRNRDRFTFRPAASANKAFGGGNQSMAKSIFGEKAVTTLERVAEATEGLLGLSENRDSLAAADF